MTKTVQPGQDGAVRHLRMYGDQLVCVRYRVDPDHCRRYTTVELVIDESPLPQAPRSGPWVYVQLQPDEDALCHRIQNLGGSFNKKHRLWQMTPTTAKRLRLLKRLIPISS